LLPLVRKYGLGSRKPALQVRPSRRIFHQLRQKCACDWRACAVPMTVRLAAMNDLAICRPNNKSRWLERMVALQNHLTQHAGRAEREAGVLKIWSSEGGRSRQSAPQEGRFRGKLTCGRTSF